MITILIVDDDHQAQTILMTLFSSQNYAVVTADNGRQGLEQVKKRKPDLIISDIMMPEMNGFRFCRELKQQPEFTDIPFIFYSATFVGQDDQKLALNLGADRFVIKPKDNLQFLQIVQNVLEEYQRGQFHPDQFQNPQADELLDLYEKSLSHKLEETVKRLQQQQYALTLSEKHLKEAQEIAHLGHWEYGLKTETMLWSDQIFRILGHAPQAFTPSLEIFYQYVHEEDLEDLRAAFRKALENKMAFHKEFRLQHSKGPCYVHVRTQVQCDNLGNAVYVIGTLQDITEQKLAALDQQRLQNELFQVQKMESLGRLASGISHDFNNLLGIINGHLHQAQKKIAPDHQAHSNLKQIQEASQRASDLINQILSYGRCELADLKPLAIADCLKNNLELLKPILPADITLHTDISNNVDSLMILADETQLQQIILNLCKNAIQAMREKGTLTTSLRAVNRNRNQLPKSGNVQPGQYVEICCSDTGCGMTTEIINKIFDPFFTTKKNGTGMGLSVIHNLVNAHHGFITVDSELDKGTTFHVFLPRYLDNKS